MTKSELIRLFPDISPTAFRMTQDDMEICGKWAHIAYIGDQWDVWIHNVNNLRKGLSTRRIRSLHRRIEACVKTDFNELDGEAWFRLKDHKKISEIRPILGIRKKKRVSEATLRNLRKYAK